MVTKFGHRGAAGYAPENTLKSFGKALELNVDAVELDVYVCKSGELVVIHDDKVDRTTDGKGYVIEKTLEELKSLDAGEGEHIPTLDEVFDLVDKRVKINVELKGAGTALPVNELINKYITENGWTNDHFIISSFNHHELQLFKHANANISIGALITGIPIDFAAFGENLGAQSVNVSMEFINQEFVDDAHKRGLAINVWTANDEDDIDRMKKLGVDGIFSNFPDRL